MDLPSVFDHPEPPSATVVSPPTTTTTEHPADDPQTSETTRSNSIESSAKNNQDTPAPSTITLDQELLDIRKTLGGVGASLGGWWGKVQKQSADALAGSNITAQINDARKDLASLNLIEKAKREVERLGDHAKEGYLAISSEIEKGPEPESIEGRVVNVDGVELTPPSGATSSSSVATTTATEKEASVSSKGKERALNEPPTSPTNPLSVFESTTFSSFFSKITKDSESLTASLQSKIPQLPGSSSFDLTEFQKRAEGYLAKGEVYLQDVGKELKEFVQDAVKVIPPSEQDETAQVTDHTTNRNSLSNSGLTEKRRMLDLKRESMVAKLRREKSQLLVDPKDHDTNAFDDFILALQKAGGLEGEAWTKRIDGELQIDEPDLSALKNLLEKLVPNSMTSETFWTRYFFRIYQIDQEEAARRLVLSAAQEDTEGDFSWDIEDESEPSSPAVIVKTRHESGGETENTMGKEDQAETPKPSNLSSSMIGSTPTNQAQEQLEDEWGNSPVENTFSSPGTKTQKIDKGNGVNQLPASHVSRRTSASEPDTSDGFDVVSAQQSSDEKSIHRRVSVTTTDNDKGNRDADEDSDWE